MQNNEHYQKALSKISENQFDEAIELLTTAIYADDSDPFFFNQRAVCYLNLNKFELSLFDMNRSIELDDTYAYFYSSRGFLKARMQDAEGAIEDYEKSLELDPTNEITYNNMGLVLEQMGNFKGAKSMYKKGNEILGYDPESRELNEEGEQVERKPKTEPAEEDAPILNKKMANKGRKKLAKEVFSKKSTFKEFLGFIGSGFKLKNNDKS